MGNVADNDHIFGSEKKKSRGYDALDRELDAALAQYGAGEPKAGLEQSVLTNLQAEREKIARGLGGSSANQRRKRWAKWATLSGGCAKSTAFDFICPAEPDKP